MRLLEVRRHSIRSVNSEFLSQSGVNLAQRVGNSIGPFNKVITSEAQRAIQTAIAMGFAVHGQLKELSPTMGETIRWDAGFAAFGALYKQSGPTAKFIREQGILWRAIIESLSDGGKALVITHSGIVEAGAVACMPGADHQKWGNACGFCEGVRLSFEDGAFTGIEILRVEQP